MGLKLEIALVQTQLIWENPEENRRLIKAKIAQIPSIIDLIILPEMFTTGFTMNPSILDKNEGQKTIKWMLKIAVEKQAAITGSIPFFENGLYYNRLLFIEPNGEIHTYDKRHTFTLAGEDKIYKKGTQKLIVDYKGFKICPFICYDLRFPVWARNTENYDVLLYVANWPKPRVHAWDALLKARAIENMSYCIGVNRIGVDDSGLEYSGHSAVYDGLGEMLVFSEKEDVIYTTLEKEHIESIRKKLKFLDDKDTFSLTI